MLCKTQFQIIHDCSDRSLLSAQRCFGCRLLPIVFKSQYWNSLSFAWLHLQLWCWFFSLWFWLMSLINNLLLCFCRASFSGSNLSHEIVQIFYRICSAKLSFNSFTVVPMEVSYKRSAALLFACFLFCSSLKIETLREFRKTTLANVMLIFFSLVLIDVSYKQSAALLLSCFLFWFKSQSWKCSNLL